MPAHRPAKGTQFVQQVLETAELGGTNTRESFQTEEITTERLEI